MDRQALNEYIAREIVEADAEVSLFTEDLDTGETLHGHREDEAVSSASTIKVPIMLAALEAVRRGDLSLDGPIAVPGREILDDTEVFEDGPGEYPLRVLIYWMIVTSDNTATNVLIETLGFDAVNEIIRTLGMGSTVLSRKMLDFEALKAGRNNLTSARDMAKAFAAIYRKSILTPTLCDFALVTLLRQRSTDMFLRYITDDIRLAHKTGGLDPDRGHDRVAHDAGVFLLEGRRYYLGVFVTEAPDDAWYSKRLIGRISKAIYDCCKG